VRSPNEIASVATLLGLNADSVRVQLASQRTGAGAQGGGAQGGAANQASGTQNAGQRGGANLPEVTDEQCQKITATLAKHPEVQKQLQDLRAKMMNGELDRQAMQAESQKIYSAAGVDGQVARACNFKERQKTQSGGQTSAQSPQSSGGQGGFQAGAGTGQRAGGRRGMVFVVKNGKYTPKVVRLGISNYDVSEVLSGLNEGDSVAILNVAAMQARQQADLDQIRNRAGVPGLQRQQGAGGAAGGAGGGAGGAGGAARPSGQRPGGN
jgi:hypothetical protein